MHGILRMALAVAILLVASSLSSTARADAFRSPIAIQGKDVQSVTFARLVFRIPGDSEISVSSEQVRIRFLEYMRSIGYPARGAESLVFGQDDADKARFVLGGTIHELECRPAPTLPMRRCRVGIQWELMDRTTDEVSYRTTTRHMSTAGTPEQLGEELVWGAFYSLLSRTRFVEALRAKEVPRDRPRFVSTTYQRCPAETHDMTTDANAVLASTVMVRAGRATGSGVLISPDGLVLTAAHVVAENAGVRVRFQAGKEAPASIVRLNEHDDVALLRVDRYGSTRCISHRDLRGEVGAEVFAIGSPLGEALSWSLTRGIVSGYRELDGVPLLQTDASVNPGNSGGPIVDREGRWIAVTSWKVTGRGVEGIAFGVPASVVFESLGITPGEMTGQALRENWMGRSTTRSATVDDDPDPIEPLFKPVPPPPPPAPELPRTSTSRTVEQVGWIVAGAGTLGMAGSYGYYKAREDELSVDAYGRARLVNDISWLALVGGGVSVFYAYHMPRQQVGEASHGPARAEAPTWTAVVGPGSLGLGLRY